MEVLPSLLLSIILFLVLVILLVIHKEQLASLFFSFLLYIILNDYIIFNYLYGVLGFWGFGRQAWQ